MQDSMAFLNYHHLRYFRAIATEGSLTKAARHLKLSQSALSVQLRSLEQSLGQPLLSGSTSRWSSPRQGRSRWNMPTPSSAAVRNWPICCRTAPSAAVVSCVWDRPPISPVIFR